MRDLTDKLEQELKTKEELVQVSSDKIKAVTEKLDISEQKLLDFASMPDIEDQLKDRMEALQQAQERQGTAEDRVQRLGMSLNCIFSRKKNIQNFNGFFVGLTSLLPLNDGGVGVVGKLEKGGHCFLWSYANF